MADLLYASFNYVEIGLTLEDAQSMSHQGRCDDDVADGSNIPYIAEQLAKLEPDRVRKELKEYGAWDEAELADHHQNIQRLLWLAAGNIAEEEFLNREEA